LAGLVETDAALGTMAELMRRKWRKGMFAAFGDHLPSFPGLYRQIGHVSKATDYMVWQADHAFGEHKDIMAHELPGLLLRAAERAQVGRQSQRAQVALVQP
jgi:phosphoglycerol transferase MdoB-like AlkP superfamily enzyme